ncbi:hypothetical protein DSECCO2_616350 [anaerobic digester metagenome]
MIALIINFAVSGYLHGKPFRKGVDHGHADAVKTPGNFIAPAAEFTAGMKYRQGHFHGRTAGLGLGIHRDTAAVIPHGDAVIFVNRNVNLGTITGQGFVDAVVDDFINKMMQAANTGITNVHAGTNANCLQPFQYLNLIGIIGRAVVIFCHIYLLIWRMRILEINQRTLNPFNTPSFF